MLARVLRQQPRRPHFVRITQLLGLAAGQIDQPRPRFLCDHWLPTFRALSSKAASAPSVIARATQRCTV